MTLKGKTQVTSIQFLNSRKLSSSLSFIIQENLIPLATNPIVTPEIIPFKVQNRRSILNRFAVCGERPKGWTFKAARITLNPQLITIR